MADKPRVPKNELRDFEFEWVSGVARPDNPDAEIVFIKRNPNDPDGSAPNGDMTTNTHLPLGGSPSALGGGFGVEQYEELLKGLMAQNEALYTQNAILAKALEDDLYDDEDFDEDDWDDEDLEKSLYEDDDEDFDDFEDDFDDEDFEKAYDDEDDDEDWDDEDDFDELVKSHPVVAALQEQIEILSKQAETAEAIAKAQHDARLEVEFAKRAEAFEVLGVPGIEVTLRKAFELLDTDTYIEIEGVLAKAASALNESSVFDEYGEADAGYTGSKIDELLAKAATPGFADGLSREQRVFAAFKADPTIYNDLIGGSL